MSLLGIVLAILFVVVGTGAYRIYQWLSGLLMDLLSPSLSRKSAFVAVSLMVAAMLAPFLIPASLSLQIGVWVLYLGFFGVGARRIYDIALLVIRDLRSDSSR